MAVQVVERWILARLRHRRFFSLVELNTAIRQLRGREPSLRKLRFQESRAEAGAWARIDEISGLSVEEIQKSSLH